MAAAAILNLFPVAIFNIRPTLHYWSQPPCKISCKYLNPRLNYNNVLKFKMADVRHLGIVALSCRTTHDVFALGHINLSNFMLIRSIVSRTLGLEFLPNWLEMSIQAPKISFWGFWPINVTDYHRDPKKAHLCLKPRVLSIKSFNLVHICDL